LVVLSRKGVRGISSLIVRGRKGKRGRRMATYKVSPSLRWRHTTGREASESVVNWTDLNQFTSHAITLKHGGGGKDQIERFFTTLPGYPQFKEFEFNNQKPWRGGGQVGPEGKSWRGGVPGYSPQS